MAYLRKDKSYADEMNGIYTWYILYINTTFLPFPVIDPNPRP